MRSKTEQPYVVEISVAIWWQVSKIDPRKWQFDGKKAWENPGKSGNKFDPRLEIVEESGNTTNKLLIPGAAHYSFFSFSEQGLAQRIHTGHADPSLTFLLSFEVPA